MTRLLFSPLTCAFALLAVACTPTSETTDSTDSSGGATSNGTGGGSDTGSATGGDEGVLVGTFQVKVIAPDAATSTPGRTSLVGKIYDGPSPEQIVWEKGTVDGDCVILKPRVPFCSTPCGGSAVCVEDETCQDYPTAGSAGTITAKGINLAAGGSEFSMDPIANNYQPPVDAALAYPAFAAGDVITLDAAGDKFAAFTLQGTGVDQLELSADNIPLVADTPVTLTWTASTKPDQSRILVKLDISHHGGTKGKIECDTADDGSLDLSGALITELLDLGVAGFPTIIVERKTVGSTTIPEGRIDLAVSSTLERVVTIDGLTSCTDDTQCPQGQTCQDDLTCK